jgi:hypothetical protein
MVFRLLKVTGLQRAADEPTAHWSYLYTLYLAAIYKLFGTYPVLAKMIQALIAGIFQPLLLWRIGNRLFQQICGFGGSRTDRNLHLLFLLRRARLSPRHSILPAYYGFWIPPCVLHRNLEMHRRMRVKQIFGDGWNLA